MFGPLLDCGRFVRAAEAFAAAPAGGDPPDWEWTVQCHLDLETLRDEQTGRPIAAIVDYKAKGTPLAQRRPPHDP